VTGNTETEFQYSKGNMETRNLDTWTSVFIEQASGSIIPLPDHHAYAMKAISGGHSTGQMPIPITLLPSWSETRSGWAVLVPNRFLSQSSFHTGYTPSWTQGTVIGEYRNEELGQMIIVCNLGGNDCEKQLEAKDCRIANGAHVGAEGSEGGHGYGWPKKTLSFNRTSPPFLPSSTAEGGDTILLPNHTIETGDTILVDKNQPCEGCARNQLRSISEYEEPSDVMGVDDTLDSTARTTFPKVRESLPEYMLFDVKASSSDVDSSGSDWIPEFKDCEPSSESDVDEYIKPQNSPPVDFAFWRTSSDSYKASHLDMEQLTSFYRKQSWNSPSVSLLGSRETFTGLLPGFRMRDRSKIPMPEDVFNLYWTNEVLAEIVKESNRYVVAPLSSEGFTNEGYIPKTKGAQSGKI